MPIRLSRRELVHGTLAATALAAFKPRALASPSQVLDVAAETPLAEFAYEQIELRGEAQLAQRRNVTEVLMSLNEDSLLQPFRAMAGQPAPGVSLGGWYEWKPDYDHHHDDAGLAPGSTFGQWTSALARLYACSKAGNPSPQAGLAERAVRLNALLAQSISPSFFAKTRFAGYTFDKLACGLMDGYRLLADPAAFPTLYRVADAAEPSLPGHAVDREVQWKPGADISWMWDETYTLPENLYLLSALGAGSRFRRMAEAYLDDATYFEPLARNLNVLADKHAYSYVNALCSAMQAFLAAGSSMHLQAAVNGFEFLQQQSFAPGGWGPDELLRKPGFDELAKSLTLSHNGFETPCGSYAHTKLTRYLLRATRDGRYGDSMERILHNTVFGALPLQPDGRSFYSSDYNDIAQRVYSVHRWPCCSGTLPQVVADYGINTYLRSPGAVWVNLYQPSILRWTEAGTAVTLEQITGYPDTGAVRLRITLAHPAAFTLHLRIPGWASGATLQLNGRPEPVARTRGFTSITRIWRGGDQLDLALPMRLRLEQLPANGGPAHPDTVALLSGPLVLFAIRHPGETGPLQLTAEALLAAERIGLRAWQVQSPAGPRTFVPFPEIGGRLYTTYLRLA